MTTAKPGLSDIFTTTPHHTRLCFVNCTEKLILFDSSDDEIRVS